MYPKPIVVMIAFFLIALGGAVMAPHVLLAGQMNMPATDPTTGNTDVQYSVYLPLTVQEGVETATATPTPTSTEVNTPTQTPTSTPTATPTTEPQPGTHGFFALDDWLTYNGATAVDAQGGVHLAFYTSDERHSEDPRGQAAYYAYCPGATVDCTDPSNWIGLVQFDSQVNEVQIVATKDGRPRILIRRNGSRANEYNFYACETNCTDALNWSGVFVAEAAGVELNNASLPQHSLALDSQDRPRFVYGNGWGIGRPSGIYYAYCDASDCTQQGSWQDTLFWGDWQTATISADYATLVFDGDKPRVLTRYTQSGLAVELDYYECNSACDDRDSWGATAIPYPGDQLWANWDLVLDSQGRPRLALYEPAHIDINVSGRLFYAWCDENCTSQDTPFQMVEVAQGEGKNVDIEIDKQGRTHMVYDAGQRGSLGQLWCDTDCASASQWQRRILETSDELQAQFPVAIPFTCNQETEHAWLDAVPQAVFDKDNRLVVAYDIVHYATCYYTDPAHPDDHIITHVDRIWWAVRWARFAQP